MTEINHQQEEGQSAYSGLTVNYHLIKACNMACKFCFARYADLSLEGLKSSIKRERDLKVVDEIGRAGVRKITFVGGEPTLCPWLDELIRRAKEWGLVTMIVTNGSRLTSEWLQCVSENLDWVALSIDSLQPPTNLRSGRNQRSGEAPGKEYYRNLVTMVRGAGLQLKINTTVSAYNHREFLGDFIEWASPARWKIFQVLPIRGQNDAFRDEYVISDTEFRNFLQRHRHTLEVVDSYPESNEAMTGSYAMIDPEGCFYDNVDGAHRRGEPVWKVGFERAFSSVRFDFDRFKDRGGLYES